MNEQKILTETINKEYYVLTKQDNIIILKKDHSPFSQWSNCIVIEYKIRLTKTKGVIEKDFFSDVSGRQNTWTNKIYIPRTEIEEVYNKALTFEEIKDDEAENFEQIKNLYLSIDKLYERFV